jgi:hypothetical protein
MNDHLIDSRIAVLRERIRINLIELLRLDKDAGFEFDVKIKG